VGIPGREEFWQLTTDTLYEMTQNPHSPSAFAWYWNRLRCMSPAEIGYRLLEKCVSHLQKMGIGTASTIPQQNFSESVPNFIGIGRGILPQLYIDAADKILQGKLRIFALNHVFGQFPQWNQDPKTGTVAPLAFSKSLDYRNESLVGDIKYLWELNRHLHLVTLAQAYRLSKDRHYLDGLQRHLESWFDQCPYLRGPNWTSSLELAIRLINWSIAWQLIGGIDSLMFSGVAGKKFRERWLATIYQHMHFIRGYYSRFSSANNHLIGELAGIFVGSLTWPFWPETAGWQREAQDELTREALLQNTPDGVNREQAISYQQFVVDFLLIAGLSGRASEAEFSPEYWKRIEAMLEFVASVMDVRGNIPMIGDADDGYVVRLFPKRDFCPYRSLLATGAVLFGREDFKRKAGRFDDKSRWLLGREGEEMFRRLANTAPTGVRQRFPEGGYYIMGCDFDTDKEIRIVIDAGPLGYLSIAAHGHADALAFTLSLAGNEVLIDPGTYAYHTDRIWRDYFRGTAAHNTVRVDGQDQSVKGGNFMWLRHAHSACRVWESHDGSDRFVGVHDGYQRLPDPVVHEREMVFDKRTKRLEIIDTLRCAADHMAERCWHFAETVDVTVAPDGTVDAQVGVHRLRLQPEESSVQSKVYRGESTPPWGWVSRHFGIKVPTTTVVWTIPVKGATQLRATLECLAKH